MKGQRRFQAENHVASWPRIGEGSPILDFLALQKDNDASASVDPSQLPWMK